MRELKIIFCLLMSISLFSCQFEYTSTWDGQVAPQIRIGEGTKNNPYVISSSQELAWLSVNAAKYGGFKNSYFRLAVDLDMWFADAQCKWTPISVFSGEFDGDGHVISNLTRAHLTSGLFDKITENGVVKNLKIDGYKGQFVIDNSKSSGTVAITNHGQIRDCTITGELLVVNGVCAYNYGQIVRCNVFAEIINRFPLSTHIYSSLATVGLVGENYGKIEYSLFNGKANVGIARNNWGKIEYCGVQGEADNSITYNQIDGAEIRHCYATTGGSFYKEMNGKRGGLLSLNFTVIGSYIVGYDAFTSFKTCFYADTNTRQSTFAEVADYYSKAKKISVEIARTPDFVKTLNKYCSSNEIWEMDAQNYNNGFPIINGIRYPKTK